MKSLYTDKDARYSNDAIELASKTAKAVRALFDEYVSKGYSPREISHLMQQEIVDMECETVLTMHLLNPGPFKK